MKSLDYSEWGNQMGTIPIIMCCIGCFCLLTPVRKALKEAIDKCISDEENEPEGITYKEKAGGFNDCYDISNPLTYKQGKLRLLNVQIENLEAEGEEGKE